MSREFRNRRPRRGKLASISAKLLSAILPWYRVRESADRLCFIQHVRAMITRVLYQISRSPEAALALLKHDTALSALVEITNVSPRGGEPTDALIGESGIFRRYIFEEVCRAKLKGMFGVPPPSKVSHHRWNDADLVLSVLRNFF